MHQVNAEMKSCIEECLRCYQICLSTAMGHCLEAGGEHTEAKHFSLMMACAEICRTSAHFMLIGSDLHKRTCRLCGEIRDQCAADCERIGEMKECVDTCRRCAESKNGCLNLETIPSCDCFGQAELGCRLRSERMPERIADQQHPEHQFRVDRRTPGRRVVGLKRFSDRVQIKKPRRSRAAINRGGKVYH